MPDTAAAATDPAAIRQWLTVLHGDSPGLIHVCRTNDWHGATFPTTALDQAAQYAAALDAAEPAGVYVRMTTLRTPLPRGRRGSATDTHAITALWADLDIAGPGHKTTEPLPPDTDAARAIITEAALPPATLWVHSGGGLYPVWLLSAPHDVVTAGDLDQVAALSTGWQTIIGAAAGRLGWHYGTGVGDLARVLRIPGTTNRKVPGDPRPCRIIDAAPVRYTLEQLHQALAVAQAAAPPPPAPERPTTGQPVTRPAPAAGSVDHDQARVGDDFNTRGDWGRDVLLPAGWRHLYDVGPVQHWQRPGKDGPGGSATINALGTDRFHVFTDAAAPLEPNTSYHKFAAYALLHHRGDWAAATRALAAAGYGTTPAGPDGAATNAELLELAGVDPAAPLPFDPTGRPGADPPPRPDLDVTNAAVTADWLRDNLGRGLLASMFNRSDTIVHTPREGEGGYVPLTEEKRDGDGPAQVRAVTANTLASRITYTYRCFKEHTNAAGITTVTPAIFPLAAARVAVDVPDMLPNLRPLRGVVHAPVLRADGTVLSAPGYDPATGLLHLPDAGLVVPPVPDNPTGDQVTAAVALLDYMVGDFTFVTKDDRANYYGLLLTPLLREMLPAPYKLGAIGAPQPGSGKSLLASVLRIVHGGVFRAEIPSDEPELRKQITAILDVTTGPVVQFDNVTGVLRSSTLAGLLTSGRWDDRRLGATEMISRPNDRLWVVTGNNLTLGGDLTRRALWVTIDPGIPNPELRTNFTIPDLEDWARRHRGDLIQALLTIARAWVVAGRPTRPRAGDGFARWLEALDGLLTHAGVPGTVDSAESARQQVGADDDEWATFLAAVHRAHGDSVWTVKQILADIDTGNLHSPGQIPMEALPADLAEKANRSHGGLPSIARSLGRWLANRDGRWAGQLTVRSAGERAHSKLWRIQSV